MIPLGPEPEKTHLFQIIYYYIVGLSENISYGKTRGPYKNLANCTIFPHRNKLQNRGKVRFFQPGGFSFLKTCRTMVFTFFGFKQGIFAFCMCESQEILREVVDFLLDYSQDVFRKKPSPFRST